MGEISEKLGVAERGIRRLSAAISPFTRHNLYSYRVSDRALVISLTLGAFVLYLRTLAPGILDGDSGEWQYMASVLGIPHSTGYPLYLLLAKLFTLFPIGNPAWRVNLLSAVCAALSLPFVYLVSKRVSGSRPGALFAGSIFALAPTLWASAVEAEVYALNTLLLAITLYLAVRWYDDNRPLDFCLLAFAFGLALDNHRVALFVGPALVLLAWIGRRHLNPRLVFAAIVLFIVPLLLYLYIPIRGTQLLADQSASNWALYPRAESILKGTVSAYYNNTPSGFIGFVTGFDNRNKLGFQDTTADAFSSRIGVGLDLLLQQFNFILLGFAMCGILILKRRDLNLTLILVIWALGVGGISIFLHAESTRFYFSGAYLVIALFIAVAAGGLLGWSQKQERLGIAVPALMIILPIIAFWTNFPSIDKSGYVVYDSYSRSILQDNLASNAVLIAPWEVATGIRYLQFVEGQRPDLLVIHESPVRPQFQKIMESAHSLARPFYYIQFTPEDSAATGARTVQAVGLPLLTRPLPRYPLDSELTDGIRVIGYDLNPDPAIPGRSMRVSVYYQVTAQTNILFRAGLGMADIRGVPHGDWAHQPVDMYYPTYFWKTGEYYRDVWDITMPADAPKGLYGFQLSWFPFDTSTNATHYEDAKSITFGPIRTGDFTAGEPTEKTRVEFSNGMTLTGYGLELLGEGGGSTGHPGTPIPAKHGQQFTLSLYWNSVRPIQEAYTAFVHLEDASGAVLAQSDRPPWDGMFPTDRWTVGETVRDEYTIKIPDNLPAGEYVLRVGLYKNPQERVTITGGGDEFSLGVGFLSSGQ